MGEAGRDCCSPPPPTCGLASPSGGRDWLPLPPRRRPAHQLPVGIAGDQVGELDRPADGEEKAQQHAEGGEEQRHRRLRRFSRLSRPLAASRRRWDRGGGGGERRLGKPPRTKASKQASRRLPLAFVAANHPCVMRLARPVLGFRLLKGASLGGFMGQEKRGLPGMCRELQGGAQAPKERSERGALFLLLLGRWNSRVKERQSF